MLFDKDTTDALLRQLGAIRDDASAAQPGSPAWWAFVLCADPERVCGLSSPLPGVIVSDRLNLNQLISAMVEANNVANSATTTDYAHEEFVDPSYDEEAAIRSLPLEDRLTYYRDTPSTYCVCDTPEQAVAYWQVRADDPDRDYLIIMTPVHREPGNTGGWRWHKWGPYIGMQSPQCEYLDDEPEIEMVYVAHIYELRKKKSRQ